MGFASLNPSYALDRLHAGGPGWRSRINTALRKAAGE